MRFKWILFLLKDNESEVFKEIRKDYLQFSEKKTSNVFLKFSLNLDPDNDGFQTNLISFVLLLVNGIFY